MLCDDFINMKVALIALVAIVAFSAVSCNRNRDNRMACTDNGMRVCRLMGEQERLCNQRVIIDCTQKFPILNDLLPHSKVGFSMPTPGNANLPTPGNANLPTPGNTNLPTPGNANPPNQYEKIIKKTDKEIMDAYLIAKAAIDKKIAEEM